MGPLGSAGGGWLGGYLKQKRDWQGDNEVGQTPTLGGFLKNRPRSRFGEGHGFIGSPGRARTGTGAGTQPQKQSKLFSIIGSLMGR